MLAPSEFVIFLLTLSADASHVFARSIIWSIETSHAL